MEALAGSRFPVAEIAVAAVEEAPIAVNFSAPAKQGRIARGKTFGNFSTKGVLYNPFVRYHSFPAELTAIHGRGVGICTQSMIMNSIIRSILLRALLSFWRVSLNSYSIEFYAGLGIMFSTPLLDDCPK